MIFAEKCFPYFYGGKAGAGAHAPRLLRRPMDATQLANCCADCKKKLAIKRAECDDLTTSLHRAKHDLELTETALANHINELNFSNETVATLEKAVNKQVDSRLHLENTVSIRHVFGDEGAERGHPPKKS